MHKQDQKIRILFVEQTGSAALEALRANNIVSDARMFVAQSQNASALADLAGMGCPCAFIAIEADKHFYKVLAATHHRPARIQTLLRFLKQARLPAFPKSWLSLSLTGLICCTFSGQASCAQPVQPRLRQKWAGGLSWCAWERD